MERLVCEGWQLLKCRYCCLLVGFMWTEVLSLLSEREILVSRKVISEEKIVEVKDTEEEALREEMKEFREFIP